MMIRVNNRYLDFSGTVEMERQSKLFEEIDRTRGDFSYQSSIPTTHNNLDILGLPFPDNASKIVYTNIDCDLISNTGEVLYSGYLRVEGLNKREIRFRVFSGNSNWISLLTGNMTEMELSQYDQAITGTNIISRFSATDGIVFPIADWGSITTRSANHLVIEDFTGCFYLKTLMKEVFIQSGLKLAGELLEDPIYNKIVIATNTRSKQDQVNHSLYVGKSTTQNSATSDKIDFDLQTSPFYVGEDIAFNSNNDFEPSATMIVDLTAHFESSSGDGVVKLRRQRISPSSFATEEWVLVSVGDPATMTLNSFKMYNGYRYYMEFSPTNGSGSVTLTAACTWKITPRYIYKSFGKSAVPLWSKQQFVNNILSLFNTVTDYDPYSKTVTVNLFKKLKSKEPIDLGQYIQVIDTDYAEFIDNYGQSSVLSYAEGSEEDMSEYNISAFFKYGSGVITVNNDYIQDSADIISLDFAAPLSYVNGALNASVEKTAYLELNENETQDLTSVTDNSGTARFNVILKDVIIGDLVRINSNAPGYNGDWYVTAIGTLNEWIEVYNMDYISTDEEGDPIGTVTGEISVLRHKLTSNDDCYLFINIPAVAMSDISTFSSLRINALDTSTVALAYFALINTGKAINTIHTQSLTFSTPIGNGFYQRTMLDAYWKDIEAILNDPVKLICEGKVPETVFRSLTPLRPVYLTTQETTNRYYVNKISGYTEAKYPFRIELIKLP
jgi:hypothetical protein